MVSNRLISFGDDGAIEADQPKVGSKYKVRFPTEREQKNGMTEVPRENRKKKIKRGK